MGKSSSWWKGMVLAGSIAFMAAPTHAAELVVNGGFETGDFAGWTGAGETIFNGVQCPGPNPTVYAGQCGAFFGPFDSAGGIEQVIDFGSAGVAWDLSFALESDGSPSNFTAVLGGQVLQSLVDPLAGPYALYKFSGISTAATETLAFSFFDPSGFLLLDAVYASVVPEPSTVVLLSAALGAFLVRRRRRIS